MIIKKGVNLGNLVSIIITTYKGASHLSRAINSAINQSYKSIEIIIVDDNDPLSNERKLTENVIRKYDNPKIKYIKHEQNKNGAAARNTGISYSKGRFICFLDDDDFYFPDRVRESVSLLLGNSLYGAIYCGVILTKENEISRIVQAEKELTQKDILVDELAIGTGSNLFVRKEILEQVGVFDERFKRYQDLEYMLRILNRTRVINLNKILIVKATNGNDNIPHYTKLRDATELYLQKFGYLINNLKNNEKEQVYSYHYGVLLYYAIKTQDKVHIEESIKYLKKYRKLTKKEKVTIFVQKYKLMNDTVCDIGKKTYRFFKVMRRGKDTYDLWNDIEEETKEMIMNLILENEKQ